MATTTRSGRTVKPTAKALETEVKVKKEPKVKKEKEPARTLDLTTIPEPIGLEENDKMGTNFKLRRDWANEDYEFYKKYFYTPPDDITKRYKEVVEKYEELPVVFINGIANFEVKPEFKQEPKQNVLYSKLLDGSYEVANSKSDKNIAASIKFFRNNLPSFKKYRDDDNLLYIIKENRLLLTELLEYSYQNKSRLATLKSKINAIIRIIRIAYKGKTYCLYDKYSVLIIMLGQYIDLAEGENELSEIEVRKFINWTYVIQIREELQQKWDGYYDRNTKEAYDTNQKLLLISLYSLIPPLRREPLTLKFTTKSQDKGDWILFIDNEVILDLNEEKKRHKPIQFNLSNGNDDSKRLAKMLKQSYDIYKREAVFTLVKDYPNISKQASVSSLDDRLSGLFKTNFPNLNISINSFRSSYVSYIYSERAIRGKQLSVNEKNKIAEKMRTSSLYLDLAYNKIIDDGILRAIPLPAAVAGPLPVAKKPDGLSSYEKQLASFRKYYDKNKDEIQKKQKEYRSKLPDGTQYLRKLLSQLNNDPKRIDKTSPKTLDKYKIVIENGKYVSKL
jgi:hypothetical protein